MLHCYTFGAAFSNWSVISSIHFTVNWSIACQSHACATTVQIIMCKNSCPGNISSTCDEISSMWVSSLILLIMSCHISGNMPWNNDFWDMGNIYFIDNWTENNCFPPQNMFEYVISSVTIGHLCYSVFYVLSHCGLVTSYGHRSGSTMAQVMACCLTATRHYLSHCWPRSMSQSGVTRPQWV